jgi:phosphohistidine swiveling domain-containing protein
MASNQPRTVRLEATAVTPVPAAGAPLWVGSRWEDGADLSGHILLMAESIGPAVASLVMRSAGIVCKSPVLTGHVPILARELGFPCMIGVSGLHLLRDAGEVELLPHEQMVIGTWT